jgi:hypothetical protein
MKQTFNITELAEYGSRAYFAAALGVNKVTLLRAERKGLLKAAGPSSKEIYYTKAAIEKYLGVK